MEFPDLLQDVQRQAHLSPLCGPQYGAFSQPVKVEDFPKVRFHSRSRFRSCSAAQMEHRTRFRGGSLAPQSKQIRRLRLSLMG